MESRVSISEATWDGTVALAYAAEQLFTAAQLLTSDRIPADHALRVSCEQHISRLMEYREFLPKGIGTELEAAYVLCNDKEHVEISKEDAQQLASRVMDLLRAISRIIGAEPSTPLAA
jgi:hypothetical protein